MARTKIGRCSLRQPAPERGFHRNEPLLFEIVQRIDEILWIIRRFAHALHKGVPAPTSAKLRFP
jgi:hypothetical protein